MVEGQGVGLSAFEVSVRFMFASIAKTGVFSKVSVVRGIAVENRMSGWPWRDALFIVDFAPMPK